MFISTCKNTLKTLLRSPSFWMVVLVGTVYAIYSEVVQGSYGYVDMETYEMIWDTDPRYILDFQSYIKLFANMTNFISTHISTMVCAVSTAVILLRDYGDRFFEIEKAAGLKTSAYVYGRFSTLTAVNVVYNFALLSTCLFGYVITRGGVDGMTPFATFTDAFVRLVLLELIICIPAILVSVAITYIIGALFNNGISAAAGGLMYSLVYMIIGKFFGWKGGEIMEIIRNYFAPVPMKVFWFMYYFRTEWSEGPLETFNTSAKHVVTSVTAFIAFTAVISVIIYLKTRKRTV